MRALICGITGQDGSYLASFLLNKGYEIWGTSRDPHATQQHNLEKLDIAQNVSLTSMAPGDFRSVFAAIEASNPDEIYYLSGQSSVSLSFEQPIETLDSIVNGVLNILEAIRLKNNNIRFYNASSSECFGNTGNKPANENAPFKPRSPYAVAKASAHWLVSNYRESYGLHACSGILFNHESPLRPNRFVTQKIIQAARKIANGSNERLKLGRVDIQRDWGWAPEYVDAMWRMLQLETPIDLVIATGHSYSLEEFTKEAFRSYDLDWKEFTDLSEMLLRPADIMVSRADPELAGTTIDWKASILMPEVVKRMTNDSDQGIME